MPKQSQDFCVALLRFTLDWTEKQAHLGGALGAAVCTAAVERGWILRQPGTRAVLPTTSGRAGLRVVEVPYRCLERRAGETKTSPDLGRFARLGLRYARTILQLRWETLFGRCPS